MANITGRAELLSALAYVAAVRAYLRRSLALTIAYASIGLLCKEQSVTALVCLANLWLSLKYNCFQLVFVALELICYLVSKQETVRSRPNSPLMDENGEFVEKEPEVGCFNLFDFTSRLLQGLSRNVFWRVIVLLGSFITLTFLRHAINAFQAPKFSAIDNAAAFHPNILVRVRFFVLFPSPTNVP